MPCFCNYNAYSDMYLQYRLHLVCPYKIRNITVSPSHDRGVFMATVRELWSVNKKILMWTVVRSPVPRWRDLWLHLIDSSSWSEWIGSVNKGLHLDEDLEAEDHLYLWLCRGFWKKKMNRKKNAADSPLVLISFLIGFNQKSWSDII